MLIIDNIILKNATIQAKETKMLILTYFNFVWNYHLNNYFKNIECGKIKNIKHKTKHIRLL